VNQELGLNEYTAIIRIFDSYKIGVIKSKLADRNMADFWLDNAKNVQSFSIVKCRKKSFRIFSVLAKNKQVRHRK